MPRSRVNEFTHFRARLWRGWDTRGRAIWQPLESRGVSGEAQRRQCVSWETHSVTAPGTESLDRIPPHNLDAERAVLGCLLLEGGRAVEALDLRVEDFYTDAHRHLYATLRTLAERTGAVDLLTVRAELERVGLLEAVGGPAHLALCAHEASIAVHLPRYAALVREQAARREAIQACARAIGALYGANGAGETRPVAAVAEDLQQRLVVLAGQADPAARAVPILEVVDEVRAYLDAPPAARQMVRTPVPELNQRLGGGTLVGELVLVGGRPGTSKTALALQWAALSAHDGHRTLVISREMRTLALGRRFVAQQLRIPASSLRKADIWLHERQRLEEARARLGAIPLWFADQAVTVGHIRRLTRLLAPRLLVVDYVQLVESPADARAGKRLEVTAVSRALKRLATQGTGCTVVALSSLRRLGPDGKGKGSKVPPTLDDLKESGDLEADADVVVLLWQKGDDGRDRELTFAKVRDGQAGGSETLDWDPRFVTFNQIAPDAPPSLADREPGSDDVPF